MARTNYLTDLLSSIFERTPTANGDTDSRSIEDLTRALVADEGEVSTLRLARSILRRYAELSFDEKHAYLTFLDRELDLDPFAVEETAQRYAEARTTAHLKALLAAAEPPRQGLFRKLNQVDGATARIVDMRADLLDMLADDDALGRIDLDLVHLLSSWFNRGFLVLRRINWQTPADILERIVEYEAVHAIGDWNDLRRRLQPPDRRCYAYFHPCMPDDPLIFVEVALTKGIPDSVQSVLAEDRPQLPPHQLNTAVFYSISNCQKGLRGISFGNSLIKQVVQDLSAEMPQLKTFVTLSPLPGFADWLGTQSEHGEAAVAAIAEARRGDLSALQAMAGNLRGLAARHLAQAKRSDGAPLNSVARFHLGNGAMIENVHAMADLSDNGLRQSGGVMVNYLYDLNRVERRSEAYLSNKTIAASRTIRSLLKSAPTKSPFESASGGARR